MWKETDRARPLASRANRVSLERRDRLGGKAHVAVLAGALSALALAMAGCTGRGTGDAGSGQGSAQPAVPQAADTGAAGAPADSAPLRAEDLHPIQPFAVERSHGANCPDVDDTTTAISHPCLGPLPKPLAALLLALPDDAILLTRAQRAAIAAKPQLYRAVAGVSARPDFMSASDALWIRSFEGRDPADTVYLVNAPVDCRDGKADRDDTPEPVDLDEGPCKRAWFGERVYRMDAGGTAVDVTAAAGAIPAPRALTAAETARYAAHGPYPKRDESRLDQVPVMRSTLQFDGTDGLLPAGDPLRVGERGFAHLGFIAWNGRRFVSMPTVPRALWPCRPVADGTAACTTGDDAGPEPFVTDGTAAATGVTK